MKDPHRSARHGKAIEKVGCTRKEAPAYIAYKIHCGASWGLFILIALWLWPSTLQALLNRLSSIWTRWHRCDGTSWTLLTSLRRAAERHVLAIYKLRLSQEPIETGNSPRITSRCGFGARSAMLPCLSRLASFPPAISNARQTETLDSYTFVGPVSMTDLRDYPNRSATFMPLYCTLINTLPTATWPNSKRFGSSEKSMLWLLFHAYFYTYAIYAIYRLF